MDFEKFCNNEELKTRAEELKNQSEINVEEITKKYQNMNKSELYNELFRVAKSEKAKGNLDAKQLNKIFNTLSPILNEQEQINLKNLLEKLGE